jgi:Na+/pantothenate symporter
MSVTHWLSFTATDDVVAVALIVTLLVLGILFVSMFLADKFGRQSRKKRRNAK